MNLEIVTPEATLLNSEVDVVSVPGIDGAFQMLNNHAPIVSILVEGNVVFKGANVQIEEEFEGRFTESKGEYTLPIASGTIEMKGNKVVILAD